MWKDFHNYNTLVSQGLAPELKCPDCNTVLILRPDFDASPDLRLWCSVDDTYITPGLEMHQQIMNYVRAFMRTD